MSFYFSVALKHLKLSLVTLLGLGFFPLAPGTWGSLGALALFILLEFFFGEFIQQSPPNSRPWQVQFF